MHVDLLYKTNSGGPIGKFLLRNRGKPLSMGAFCNKIGADVGICSPICRVRVDFQKVKP